MHQYGIASDLSVPGVMCVFVEGQREWAVLNSCLAPETWLVAYTYGGIVAASGNKQGLKWGLCARDCGACRRHCNENCVVQVCGSGRGQFSECASGATGCLTLTAGNTRGHSFPYKGMLASGC